MKNNEKHLKVLIICQTMTYLSGSPLYNYTLALELKKRGHDVSVYSMWEDNDLRNNLSDNGVMTCYEMPKVKFDLVLISQDYFKDVLEYVKADKIINIVHSEYDCENPIINKKIDHYIAIRPSIKEHLVGEHQICSTKISVIYNGIDFERFSPDKRKLHEHDYTKVVLPCTIDMLRIKFLEHYTKRASEKFRVYIYGKTYENKLFKNEWVFINDEVFDIENYIADADFVSGILLGRINLEARAMGIMSFIHNPDNPLDVQSYFPKQEEFEKKHNISNVVKQIIKIVK